MSDPHHSPQTKVCLLCSPMEACYMPDCLWNHSDVKWYVDTWPLCMHAFSWPSLTCCSMCCTTITTMSGCESSASSMHATVAQLLQELSHTCKSILASGKAPSSILKTSSRWYSNRTGMHAGAFLSGSLGTPLAGATPTAWCSTCLPIGAQLISFQLVSTLHLFSNMPDKHKCSRA